MNFGFLPGSSRETRGSLSPPRPQSGGKLLLLPMHAKSNAKSAHNHKNIIALFGTTCQLWFVLWGPVVCRGLGSFGRQCQDRLLLGQRGSWVSETATPQVAGNNKERMMSPIKTTNSAMFTAFHPRNHSGGMSSPWTGGGTGAFGSAMKSSIFAARSQICGALDARSRHRPRAGGKQASNPARHEHQSLAKNSAAFQDTIAAEKQCKKYPTGQRRQPVCCLLSRKAGGHDGVPTRISEVPDANQPALLRTLIERRVGIVVLRTDSRRHHRVR